MTVPAVREKQEGETEAPPEVEKARKRPPFTWGFELDVTNHHYWNVTFEATAPIDTEAAPAPTVSNHVTALVYRAIEKASARQGPAYQEALLRRYNRSTYQIR